MIEDRRSETVSNLTLWEELRYIRRKVDGLETKILMIFGSITTISVAIAVYELLNK